MGTKMFVFQIWFRIYNVTNYVISTKASNTMEATETSWLKLAIPYKIRLSIFSFITNAFYNFALWHLADTFENF